MATITKEIVEMVKNYKAKFPNMTCEELGKLCGISRASANNILNGMYDNYHYEANTKKTIPSGIPYETYKNLVRCELAIDEMMDSVMESTHDDSVLFISYRRFSEIIKKHFPERFAQRLEELRAETEGIEPLEVED